MNSMNTTGAEILAAYRNKSDAGEAISLEEIIDNAIAAAIESAKAEEVRQEPLGYIDAEQLRRWDALRGTQFESPERCYMPWSSEPFKSEMNDCSLPVYIRPQPVRELSDAEATKVWLACHSTDGEVNIGEFARAILKAASLPVRELSDAELLEIAHMRATKYAHNSSVRYYFTDSHMIDAFRDALKAASQSAPQQPRQVLSPLGDS